MATADETQFGNPVEYDHDVYLLFDAAAADETQFGNPVEYDYAVDHLLFEEQKDIEIMFTNDKKTEDEEEEDMVESILQLEEKVEEAD